MPVYSVSYDLNTPGQKYSCVEKRINSICTKHIKYVETSWIVKYSGNAKALYNEINKCLDESDRILVIKVVNNYSGWLNKKYWAIIEGMFD